MTYLEEIAAFRERHVAIIPEFLDVNGVMIHIGNFVHYVREPEEWEKRIEYDELSSVWNNDRWGVVVNLVRTPKLESNPLKESTTEFDYSVKVIRPNVITSRRESWSLDEFFCEPTSLEVVK